MATENALGFIGSMRDGAEELDEIVEEAMMRRQISAWVPRAEDFAVLEAMIEATGRPLNALLDEALHMLVQLWNRQQAENKPDDPDQKPI
jgi:hypothetical protein